MRVAALYDIHGNLPALEAVLAEVCAANVDRVVVGGDVVPGPMTGETLARLAALDVPVQYIYGNCEVATLAAMAGRDPGRMPESAKDAIRWTAEQLRPRYESVFASWPKTLRLDVAGLGAVLFCHGTPRDENEIFTRLTSDARLRSIFDGVDASIVVCGHTHMQFDLMVGNVRVVNAGSVGMPFGSSGAYWLLLGPDVQLKRTEYDLTKAAERIRHSDYPQREEFASKYVLQPPSEAETLELFARAEPK
jgi:predicted phosphodiesterase